MLRDLLFDGTNETPALFSTQVELARALCGKLGLTADKHRSTAVFLNQILHGSRAMPERWQRALMEIVKDRGLDEETQTRIALTCGLSPTGLAPLLHEQASASDVLILNARPIELTVAREHHEDARSLERLVMSGLMRGCRYHYCLASQQDARALWIAIQDGAEVTFGKSALERVQMWVDGGLLRVSVVPELLLLHPTVGFNTDSPDRLSAFVWHAPYDWEQCLRLPDRQLAAWLGSVRGVLNTQAQWVPLES